MLAFKGFFALRAHILDELKNRPGENCKKWFQNVTNTLDKNWLKKNENQRKRDYSKVLVVLEGYELEKNIWYRNADQFLLQFYALCFQLP